MRHDLSLHWVIRRVNGLDHPKQGEHASACPHSAGIIFSYYTEKAI